MSDRGGVRLEDRLRGRERVETREQLLLELEPLGRRLDDDVGVADRVAELGRRRDLLRTRRVLVEQRERLARASA